MKRKVKIDLGYKDHMGLYYLVLSSCKSPTRIMIIATFRSFNKYVIIPLAKIINEMEDI